VAPDSVERSALHSKKRPSYSSLPGSLIQDQVTGLHPMVTQIKALVPPSLEPALLGLWFFFRPIMRGLFFGRQRYCPICHSHCRLFLSHGGLKHRRPDVVCPVCLTHDRHRLAYVFLSTSTNLYDGLTKSLLHFAPEPEFMRQFKRIPSVHYVSADWASPHSSHKIDITNTQLPDSSFDVIYCSHVLEHVVEDRRAIQEMFRVLTPGGWALIQVPMGEQPQTIEFARTSSGRQQPAWQTKHVRRYGIDFGERLFETGFEVQSLSAHHLATAEDCTRMSLITSEPLFFCRKPV
jgi:SAM-dependent methyltransferase